jgi:hypothetical protein
MGVVSDRPTAGQASLEYVAALALIAAVFVVAAPAVGAPDIPKLVVAKMRLALCIVADDVCSDRAAREAGLAPCPLKSDLTGWEASASIAILDLGNGWALNVTRRSDGSVSVVRTAKVHAGLTGGPNGGFAVGPVKFGFGVDGTIRARVVPARAWEFPDEATALQFLKHATLNTINEPDFPATWHSVEQAREVAVTGGILAGANGYRESALLGGAGGSADAALGARVMRDGAVTLYGRMGYEGEFTLPFLPSPAGTGRDEWLVEFTFGRDGPRELALRRGDSTDGGSRFTETHLRLDLRDPGNLEVARLLLQTRPSELRERADAVFRRIETHGIIERTVSEVSDDSRTASVSLQLGAKVGLSGKQIKVHRKLVEATARTGGRYERERFDCQPS